MNTTRCEPTVETPTPSAKAIMRALEDQDPNKYDKTKFSLETYQRCEQGDCAHYHTEVRLVRGDVPEKTDLSVVFSLETVRCMNEDEWATCYHCARCCYDEFADGIADEMFPEDPIWKKAERWKKQVEVSAHYRDVFLPWLHTPWRNRWRFIIVLNRLSRTNHTVLKIRNIHTLARRVPTFFL